MTNIKVRSLEPTCQKCEQPATMAATNVNVNGHWHYCTQHMREALERQREKCLYLYQYVGPIDALIDVTPEMRALVRV